VWEKEGRGVPEWDEEELVLLVRAGVDDTEEEEEVLLVRAGVDDTEEKEEEVPVLTGLKVVDREDGGLALAADRVASPEEVPLGDILPVFKLSSLEGEGSELGERKDKVGSMESVGRAPLRVFEREGETVEEGESVNLVGVGVRDPMGGEGVYCVLEVMVGERDLRPVVEGVGVLPPGARGPPPRVVGE